MFIITGISSVSAYAIHAAIKSGEAGFMRNFGKYVTVILPQPAAVPKIAMPAARKSETTVSRPSKRKSV